MNNIKKKKSPNDHGIVLKKKIVVCLPNKPRQCEQPNSSVILSLETAFSKDIGCPDIFRIYLAK